MATANPRYEGKPLLRLIELYVLNAIDSVDPADREQMEALTPNLQRAYGREGSWHEVVAAVMHFPPDLPEGIREMWAKNAAIAQSRSIDLTPQAFAEMFVDTNIPT